MSQAPKSKVRFQVEEEEKVPAGPVKEEESEEELNLSADSIVSKRGRKAIPDQWTGIMKVEGPNELVPLQIRDLAPDLLLQDALPPRPRTLRAG